MTAPTYKMMDDDSLTNYIGMTWRPSARTQAVLRKLVEMFIETRGSLADTEDLHWYLKYWLVTEDLCDGHDVEDLATVAMLDAYGL